MESSDAGDSERVSGSDCHAAGAVARQAARERRRERLAVVAAADCCESRDLLRCAADPICPATPNPAPGRGCDVGRNDSRLAARAPNQGHWFLNAVAPIEYLLVTGLFNIFPLPQVSGFRRSFRHAGEAIDRGYHVIVFPEGRRSDDGTPQPFKSGAGLLWKELGTSALPVRLEGLGEIKARHSGWFRSGKISVSVGRVLTLQREKSPEGLTDELRRGVFDQ